MAASKNEHGLSRRIPEKDKRKIRKRCGFGCVVCGLSLFAYHHFDPQFKDAKRHDKDGITTLCPTHHSKAHNGQLSPGAVKAANANPECCKVGFSHDTLESDSPIVFLGNLTFVVSQSILELNREAVIKIEPPEERGAPSQFSAIFHDKRGKLIAAIRKNEWYAMTDNCDIEIIGRNLKIRFDPDDISLEMSIDSPRQIRIKKLNMYYKGYRAYLNENGDLEIQYPSGGISIFNGASFIGCTNGISF